MLGLQKQRQKYQVKRFYETASLVMQAFMEIGAEAILEGGSIAGGTLEGSLGVDAGITGSVEISVSGTEVVNAIKSGTNFAAEQVGKIERGLKDKYDDGR